MGQKLGIVSFTEHGSQLNERLREMLERSGYVCESYAAEKYAGKYHLFPLKVSAKAWTEKMFQSMDALLFIGACGIAVRSIAPYLQGKDKDPAVVVLDERGIFAISLLSGHLGGANELTAVLANLTGAIPVITTATDINGRFAVDVFAKKQNLWISDLKAAKAVSAAVLDEEPVGFFSEFPVTGEIPCELQRLADGERFEGNCGMVLSLNEEKNPFSITKIDTWHDPEQGALRGPNRIHILESDGLKIAHMGDIGCPLTREQKDLLKHLDAILIPVGGYYTIDAVQAKAVVDDLASRAVIPMHYRSDHFGYPVIGRLEEFTGLCRNVVEYDSNTLLLTAETRPQTAVLKL